MSQSSPLLLTDKVLAVDVTIRLYDANGNKSTQCVGGSANYGGTVKSNRAAYLTKMKSQIKRGVISFKVSKAEITVISLSFDGPAPLSYVEMITL